MGKYPPLPPAGQRILMHMSGQIMHAEIRDALEQPLRKGKDLHLRHLHHFLVAAETESFTEAAQKLRGRGFSVDRSTVGRQIKDLQDWLGVKLFDQTGRAIKLNQNGKAFAECVEEVLWRFNKGLRAIQAQALTPEIHLGFAGTPTLEFRNETTEKFEGEAAPVRVHLHDLPADACKAGLLAGDLDVAFIPEPLDLPPQLEFEPLVAYPIQCIVGQRHRLSGRSTVTAADLRDEQFIIFAKKTFPQYYEYLKKLLGFEPRFSHQYEDDEELLSAVARNHGVALMLSTVRVLGYRFNLIKVSGCKPIRVGAIFRRPAEPLVQSLIGSAKRVISKLSRAKGMTPCRGRVLDR
jgi:DNA-binding transcriptional LysR family regulator